jgi:hypothetical protein
MTEPTTYQAAILAALQSRPQYEGTTPAHVVAARRRRNKAARAARRSTRRPR